MFLISSKSKDILVFIVVSMLQFTAFTQVQDSINLKRIIVSADKANGIPSLKSVEIDSAILGLSINQSIGTVLQNYSSVFIKDYGSNGIQTVTCRGMSASHTKIYLNGLDISPASLGQTDLSILPAFLFGTVDVKYGNSSFTEGPGAIGGGVMLGSQGKLKKGVNLSVGISVGSFGQRSGNFKFGFKKNKWETESRYIYQEATNNFSYRNIALADGPTVEQTHAYGDLHGASQSVKYQVNNKNVVSANVTAVFSNREIPGLMTATADSEQEQEDDLANVQLGWKHYGKTSESNLAVGYNWSSLEYSDPTSNIHSVTLNKSFQLREDFTKNLSKNWELKSMALLMHSSATNPSLSKQAEVFQGSVLIGLNGHLKERWELGVFIQPTIFNDEFTIHPMASVAFMPGADKNLILGINFAKNTHYPSLNDLYWVPGGNPELNPETATNGEFNIHVNRKKATKLYWDVDAAVFYGIVDNWILWQPTDAGYWSSQNIKTVEHSGAEVFSSIQYKAKEVKFKISGSYQFVKAVNKETAGEEHNKQLIYTPSHTANAVVGASYKKLWLNVNYNYTGIRYITSSNSTFLPAYELVNLSLSYPISLKKNQTLKVQFDLNNVFDEEYMSVVWRAKEGRNVLFTLIYTK